MTFLLTHWWLLLVLPTVAVWAAVLLPKAGVEHRTRGRWLQVGALAVLAAAPPLIVVTGPHPDLFNPSADNAVFGVVPVWTQRLALAVLVVLGAVAVLVRTGRPRAGRSLLVALGGFSAAQAVTFAGSPRTALLALLPLLPAVVLYTSGADWPGTVTGLRWALRATVWPSLALAFGGPGWAQFDTLGRSFAGVGQLAGVAGHPNALGPVAAGLLLLELARPRGRWWPAYAAVATATLGLTQSRTAVAGALLGLLWMLAARRGLGRVVGVVGSAAVLAYAAYSPPTLGTLNGRADVWRVAWAEFTAHPLAGYGAGFLGPDYRAAHLPARLQWAGQAHDQLLQTLAASGLLGGGALAAYAVVLAVASVRAARWTGGVSVGLLGLLAAQCLTESPLRAALNAGLLVHVALLATVFVGLRARLLCDDDDERGATGATGARVGAVDARPPTATAAAVDRPRAASTPGAGRGRTTTGT